MLATELGLFGLVRPDKPATAAPCDEQKPVVAEDEDFGWPLPGLAA
jgi:hypothetical protein